MGPGPLTVGDIPIEERLARCLPEDDELPSDALFVAPIRKALGLGLGLKSIGRLAEETAMRIAVDEASGNLQLAAKALGVSDRALQMRRAQALGSLAGDHSVEVESKPNRSV